MSVLQLVLARLGLAGSVGLRLRVRKQKAAKPRGPLRGQTSPIAGDSAVRRRGLFRGQTCPVAARQLFAHAASVTPHCFPRSTISAARQEGIGPTSSSWTTSKTPRSTMREWPRRACLFQKMQTQRSGKASDVDAVSQQFSYAQWRRSGQAKAREATLVDADGASPRGPSSWQRQSLVLGRC